MIKFTLFLFAVVILQTYLSRKENKLLGLFLPLVNLIYAIVITFRLEETDRMELLSAFVLSNVSTVMLVVIFFTIKKTMGGGKYNG